MDFYSVHKKVILPSCLSKRRGKIKFSLEYSSSPLFFKMVKCHLRERIVETFFLLLGFQEKSDLRRKSFSV